jgi:hypothetical protein
MAKDRGKSLAAVLRTGIESRENERVRENAEASSRAKYLNKERDRLYKDLFKFAEAVGYLGVTSADDLLLFTYEGRQLRFESIDNEDRIRVSGGDIPEHTEISMQLELNLWVVKSPVGLSRVEQDIFFDKGLGRLMTLALGLE